MALVQLIQTARRLYAAIIAARGATDDSVRSFLFPSAPPVDNPPWGLALVFGSLLRKKAGDGLEEVSDTGIVPVVNQLTQYQGAFPPSFQTFLSRAQAAQNAGDIAAAGSYFATATKELGVFVKPTLLQYLRSEAYSKVSAALQKRAGDPVENRSADNSTPALPRAEQNANPAPPPARQETPSAPSAPSTPAATPSREMQIAVLVRSGWTVEQAQRILDGPDRSQMTSTPAPRPIVDGKTILEKASPGNTGKDNTTTDATAIAGAIKSGAELLQQLLKLAQGTGSGNKGGGANTPGDSKFPDVGGSTMSGSSYMDEDSGYSTDLGGSPSYDFINDSSEVID